MSSELQKRLISAFVLGTICLVAVWLGGVWYIILLLVGLFIAADEWRKISSCGSIAFSFTCLLIGAGIFALLYYTRNNSLNLPYFVIALLWILPCLIGAKLVAYSKKYPICFLGLVYLTAGFIALYWLRSIEHFGLFNILGLLFIIWGADTFAYIMGKSLKGPKLAPQISPNKTWSGMIGAVLGGALGALAVQPFIYSPWDEALIIGGIIGAFGQLGDLFESYFKRYYNVKDSGSIIPGHGGLLDRIDALLAGALLASVLIYLRLLIGKTLSLLAY